MSYAVASRPNELLVGIQPFHFYLNDKVYPMFNHLSDINFVRDDQWHLIVLTLDGYNGVATVYKVCPVN